MERRTDTGPVSPPRSPGREAGRAGLGPKSRGGLGAGVAAGDASAAGAAEAEAEGEAEATGTMQPPGQSSRPGSREEPARGHAGGLAEPREPLGPVVDAAFFRRPAEELAPALLGLELVHETPEGLASGIIVETEAYAGPEDRGAHSYGGRRTPRTEVMFGPAGHAYVFAIYGLHFCFNVVAAEPGQPQAVLVRALEPRRGVELMARRRGLPVTRLRDLTSGPGRLCQALAITRAQYGLPLFDPRSPLRLHHPRPPFPVTGVARGPRINIDYAGEWKDVPWRFWVAGNPHVSR